MPGTAPDDFASLLARVRAESLWFLASHAVGDDARRLAQRSLAPDHPDPGHSPPVPLPPQFALRREAEQRDLYGVLDALLILHCCRSLRPCVGPEGARDWAEYILSCQDQDGWFTRDCHRGHPREHSTAYALAGLSLLHELAPGEDFLDRVRPVAALRPLLANREATAHWLSRLGLHGPRDIPRKNLGWHYVWRSSHIGGGVAAALGMLGDRAARWFPELGPDGTTRWFGWYFDWLDAETDPRTGLWRRAFWNRFFRRPTIIDLGGAAHFLWIYEHAGRPFLHAEACIRSAAELQRDTGLYKDHPFCIDFDGVQALLFCAGQTGDDAARSAAHRAADRNAEAVVRYLAAHEFAQVYGDSHGLPGALCAVARTLQAPESSLHGQSGTLDDPFRVCWWI